MPAFAVVQDEAEYRKTHHTESDTFDKVYPDEINQGAKVLAAWAYNVAMLPEILPRNPKPAPPGMFDAPEFQQPGEKPKSSPTVVNHRRSQPVKCSPEIRLEGEVFDAVTSLSWSHRRLFCCSDTYCRPGRYGRCP